MTKWLDKQGHSIRICWAFGYFWQTHWRDVEPREGGGLAA